MTTASNINCQQSAYSTALYKNRLIATQLVSLFLIHLVGILFRKQPIKPARLFSNLQKLVLLDHILVAHASLFSWHPVEWLFPFPVENIICVSLFFAEYGVFWVPWNPQSAFCWPLAYFYRYVLPLVGSFPAQALADPRTPARTLCSVVPPRWFYPFLPPWVLTLCMYVYPLIWYMYHNTMVPRYTGNACIWVWKLLWKPLVVSDLCTSHRS